MNVYRQDCSKFGKFGKVAADLYQTMMNIRAPDGGNKNDDDKESKDEDDSILVWQCIEDRYVC